MKGRPKYLVLLVLFLLSTWSDAIAQSSAIPFHYRIGEEDFANVDVYSLVYDEQEQVLYAATNDGVYYYGQSHFHKITSPNSAIGNSYFHFQKDMEGNLHCMNLHGQVFQVSRSEMKLIINDSTNVKKGHFTFRFNYENNLVCLGDRMMEYHRAEGAIIDTTVLLEEPHGAWNFRCLPSGKYVLGAVSNMYDSTRIHLEPLPQFIVTKGRNIFLLKEKLVSMNSGKVGQTNGSYTIYSTAGEEIKEGTTGNDQDHYRQFTDSTIGVFDRLTGMDLYRFLPDATIQKRSLFSSEFLSASYQNSEGVLFLGTFKGGIIVVPSLNFIGNESKTLLTSISAYDEESYVISERNGTVMAYAMQGSAGDTVTKMNINLDNIFVSDRPIHDRQKWAKLFIPQGITGRGFANMGNGKVAFMHWKGILIFDLNRVGTELEQIKRNSLSKLSDTLINGNVRSTALCADTSNHLLYSSEQGRLYRMNFHGGEKLEVKHNGRVAVTTLYFDEGRLYCGTFNNSILVFKDDKLVQEIQLEQKTKTGQVKQLLKKGDLLFALTADGLQVYNLKTEQLEHYGIASNLLDNSVVDFDVSETHLLILRKRDHFSLPISALNELAQPVEIRIDSCLMNRRPIDFTRNQYRYDENSFAFFIDHGDFRTRLRNEIHYQLEGFFEGWKVLGQGEHQIEFLSLPIGKYTFKAKSVFQGKSSAEFTYSFTIHPPFWQRWWFYLLVALATAIAIGLLAFYRLKRVREKAEQRLQVETNQKIAINAQLKAIRAQMNPHFVFNAINSIQDLVLQQETLKSYDYLESFSRLVRLTLDYSEREFVQLEEEVTFLELYLALEALRFDHDFNYSIHVPDELQNAMIPSLIIQPFVENAIKHGLLHSAKKKQLSIDFIQEERETLCCVIRDNGIGRERSREIASRQHQQHVSFSTKAIENRMEMLSLNLNAKYWYEMKDLYTNDGSPEGTEVRIYFPLLTSIS